MIQRMLSINEVNGEYLLVNMDRTICDVFGWSCYIDIKVNDNILPLNTMKPNNDNTDKGMLIVTFKDYGEYLTVYRHMRKNKSFYIIKEDDYRKNISSLQRNMLWVDGDADETIWIEPVCIHDFIGSDNIKNNTCEVMVITHSRVYRSLYLPLKGDERNCDSYVRDFVVLHKNDDKYKKLYQNYKVIHNYKKMVFNYKDDYSAILGNLTKGVESYINNNNPYGVIAEVSYADGTIDRYLIKSHNSLVKLIPADKLQYVIDIRVIMELPKKPKNGEFHYVFRASSNGDLKQGYIKSFFLNNINDLFRVIGELNYNDDEVYVIYDRG